MVYTVPYIEVKKCSSRVEHEATTSKVDDDQLFYCRQRGMDEEEAVALVVNGFVDVFKLFRWNLPWRLNNCCNWFRRKRWLKMYFCRIKEYWLQN